GDHDMSYLSRDVFHDKHKVRTTRDQSSHVLKVRRRHNSTPPQAARSIAVLHEPIFRAFQEVFANRIRSSPPNEDYCWSRMFPPVRRRGSFFSKKPTPRQLRLMRSVRRLKTRFPPQRDRKRHVRLIRTESR